MMTVKREPPTSRQPPARPKFRHATPARARPWPHFPKFFQIWQLQKLELEAVT